MEKAQVKKIADVEAKKIVKGHEKRMHGTKKLAKGGVTSENSMKYGRNLARAMNQTSGGK